MWLSWPWKPCYFVKCLLVWVCLISSLTSDSGHVFSAGMSPKWCCFLAASSLVPRDCVLLNILMMFRSIMRLSGFSTENVVNMYFVVCIYKRKYSRLHQTLRLRMSILTCAFLCILRIVIHILFILMLKLSHVGPWESEQLPIPFDLPPAFFEFFLKSGSSCPSSAVAPKPATSPKSHFLVVEDDI